MSEIICDYKNQYYNHFSKKRSVLPPQFNRNENFLMRFKSHLPYYEYKENSLTIIYFKDGIGELIVKGQKVKVDGNSFIVSNPGYGWEYFNTNKNYIDVLSFAVSEDLISKFNFFALASEEQLLSIPFERVGKESFFIEKIYTADHYSSGRLLKYIHNQSCTESYMFMDPKELTIEVLQQVYQDQFKAYLASSKIEAVKNSTKIEVFKRLLNAYEYMHDNINYNVSIGDLSSVSALSEYHLYNSFKKIFGKTPHQYMIGIKMNKAKSYLKEGNLTVTEISHILNFKDLPSFSKLFKKTYGYSPKYFKSNLI